MELSLALEFNEKYPIFDLSSLNNIEIVAEIYNIFYKSKEIEELKKKKENSNKILQLKIQRVLEKYPEVRQRYTALSRIVIEAKQISENFNLRNILSSINKTKINKITLKYINVYFENYKLTFNTLSSKEIAINLIDKNEGNNKSPMTENEINKFKQDLINLISEINNYIETNFEI